MLVGRICRLGAVRRLGVSYPFKSWSASGVRRLVAAAVASWSGRLMFSPPASMPMHAKYGVARRDYHFLRRLLIALLVVACAAPLALNVIDPDFWRHVLYGEEW